jgi:hypothetical protein
MKHTRAGYVEKMDERRLTKRIYETVWVAVLLGEDLGEHFSTKLGKF